MISLFYKSLPFFFHNYKTTHLFEGSFSLSLSLYYSLKRIYNMQRGRNDREESASTGGPFDSFRRFGGLGHERSLMSHIFEGRDPFDDPFFTRPSGSMFGSSLFGSGVPFGDSPHVSRSNSKGPVIEELHMDEEEKEEEEEEVDGADVNKDKRKAKMNIAANKHPHVEHPDDKADETKSKDVIHSNANKKSEGTTPRVRSVSFQKVTYGGVNGAYYTATTTRSTGNGVVLEDCKQADKTTGQATHRISRGMHDKGHSLTRKLNSDGKVDTMQTLHNLNEDELTSFEQAWKGNAEGQFHGLHEGFNFNSTAGSSGGGWRGNSWLIPVGGLGFSEGGRRMGGHGESGTRPPSGGRPKKVVTINIE